MSLQAGQGCMLNTSRWRGDSLALSCIKTSLCRLSLVHAQHATGRGKHQAHMFGGTEFSTENFVLSFVLHLCRCSCCPCSVVAAVMETTGAGASLVKRACRIKVAAVGKRKGSVQR